MKNQQYRFRFTLFGKKVQMFHDQNMGVVIEKEPQVVCVYGTDCDHQNVLCAIPLCAPKQLSGMEYVIEFDPMGLAKISVGEIRIVIDFANHSCSNNKGLPCYGSDAWGQSVFAAWNAEKDTLF